MHRLPQVLTSWSRLYDLLHQLLPAERYVQGVTVQRIEQLIGYPVARRPAPRAQRAARVRWSQKPPSTWTAMGTRVLFPA